MSNVECEKAIGDWLFDVTVTGKLFDEPGIFLNEIIFTHKNGNRLCLILYDVKMHDKESLDGEYYLAAKETMAEFPSGFPTVNSIMYSPAAAAVSKRGTDEFLY